LSSIFGRELWLGKECYVTAKSDFLYHGLDPDEVDLGASCLVTFSFDLFQKVLKSDYVEVEEEFQWPYSTTPLKLCRTKRRKRFTIHFPSYGSTRIANSLEQLSACGIKYVFGLGLCGTLQQHIGIGDIILLEGSVRGDGVSRYYAPLEFPGVADFELTARIKEKLVEHGESYHMGLSFGTDALYREERSLIKLMKELGVISIDLESSAFLTVGRILGLKCCWVGVVSDRLMEYDSPSGVSRQDKLKHNTLKHEGNIHSGHISEKLLKLSRYIIKIIDEL
jgi:uridine phosphorylase